MMKHVLGLARSCQFQEEHGRQVAKIALGIFDGLIPLHALGKKERLWLKAGSILHDIGWQAGGKHHKEAMSIIINSPLLKLPRRERIMIGLIARYHRRALPSNKHQYYKSLSKDKKKTIQKLAAIVRIADGLDRAHESLVRSLECKILKSKVMLRINSGCRQGLACRSSKLAAKKKSDLFRKVFRRDIVISW